MTDEDAYDHSDDVLLACDFCLETVAATYGPWQVFVWSSSARQVYIWLPKAVKILESASQLQRELCQLKPPSLVRANAGLRIRWCLSHPKPFHGSCSTLVGFERFWGRGNFYGARRAFALLWLPLVVCLADLSSPVWKHFLPRNKKLRRIQRVASMQSMYVLQRTETTKHSKCWGLTGTDGRRAKSLRMQTPSLNFKLDLQ